jgi:hypothetical protein
MCVDYRTKHSADLWVLMPSHNTLVLVHVISALIEYVNI